jgi:hypothetical protein
LILWLVKTIDIPYVQFDFFFEGEFYAASEPISEGCRSIDIRRIHREGQLHAGNLFVVPWRRAGEPFGQAYVVVGDNAIIIVCLEHIPVIQRVAITWSAPHFGGHRPWFECPYCRRRSALIYIGDEEIACRRCFNLAYASQHEPVRQRGLMKAQNIRVMLGGNPSVIDRFPPRPKGMHWEKYRRLRAAHDQAADQFIPGLSRRA